MRWALAAAAWAVLLGSQAAQAQMVRFTCHGQQFNFGEHPMTFERRYMVLELNPAKGTARISLPFIDRLRIAESDGERLRLVSPEKPELERSATIQGYLERETGKLVLFDGGPGAADPWGEVSWRIEADCAPFSRQRN
jgi:hypothetical protein